MPGMAHPTSRPVARPAAQHRARHETPRGLTASRRALAGALLLAGLAPALHAEPQAVGPGSSLRFNGFGTVGFVSDHPSTDWGFRREVTAPEHHDSDVRADVDSRLGLQANWTPAPAWEFVGQLVLKPRASTARTEESLTEAFAAWHPTPQWTIRAGRTSPDLFLLADYRNVGFAYPWVRPSVEFYGWMPLTLVDGLDVTRSWTAAGDLRWRAKVFTGRSTTTLASTHDDGDTFVVVDSLNGLTLTAESGGLTLKGTIAEARSRPADNSSILMLHNALDMIAALPIPQVAGDAATLRDSFPAGHFVTRYSSIGLQWDEGPWRWQAEAARVTGNFNASNNLYGYLSGAYRRGNATFFAMASRVKPDADPLPDPQWTAALTPVVGPQNAALAQYAATDVAFNYNIERQDQHTIALGLRWDLNAQLALKLQFDDVHSAAYGGGLWAYNTLQAHHAEVVSGALDFVF